MKIKCKRGRGLMVSVPIRRTSMTDTKLTEYTQITNNFHVQPHDFIDAGQTVAINCKCWAQIHAQKL